MVIKQLTSHPNFNSLHHYELWYYHYSHDYKLQGENEQKVGVKFSYQTIYQYTMIVSYKRYYVGYSMLKVHYVAL